MPSRPIKDHYSKESRKIEDDELLLTEAALIACRREVQMQQDIEEMLAALDRDDSAARRARDEARSRFYQGLARIEFRARQKAERLKKVLDAAQNGSKNV
jgi:hypothetical protein